MKQPSVPLSIVYKVVQVDEYGRMWSVNPAVQIVRENGKNVVRYKLRHQVFPESETPALFVCPTLEDARVAAEFYEVDCGCQNKVRILRGYAVNPRQVDRQTILQDEAFGNEKTTFIPLPVSFNTAICDWFIPIGIVKNKQ